MLWCNKCLGWQRRRLDRKQMLEGIRPLAFLWSLLPWWERAASDGAVSSFILIHSSFGSNSKRESHHFPLGTPEVQVQVSYSVVGRHLQLLVGVSVEDGAPRWIGRLPRHGEALLVVQRQADVLSVQGATWGGGWREKNRTGTRGAVGGESRLSIVYPELSDWDLVCASLPCDFLLRLLLPNERQSEERPEGGAAVAASSSGRRCRS